MVMTAIGWCASAASVSAQWCTEPSKPSCLGLGSPDDLCRIEVEKYLSREREFRDCLVDETNQRIEESKQRSRRVVEQWNCYAKGKAFCF